MLATRLKGSFQDTIDKLQTHRESIGHLRLSIHRLEELQVADYPSWGQAEDQVVVIQGNRHQRVFRLLKGKIHQKETWNHGHTGVSSLSPPPRPQLWGLENLSKRAFWCAEHLKKSNLLAGLPAAFRKHCRISTG